MSPFPSVFLIWVAINLAILPAYKTQFSNTTTQQEYIYSYQGWWGDPNVRPSYITVTMIEDTTAYSNQDSEGSRFSMKPNSNRGGFCLQLSLDSPLTFHPTRLTKLTLQIGSDTPIATGNCDLLVAFQSNNTYISTMISIDQGQDNEIYPGCDTLFPYTQYNLSTGNIADIVDEWVPGTCGRLCKAMGYNSGAHPNFLPTWDPNSLNISYPLTFIIENNPIQNYLVLTYTNPGVKPRSCGFAESFAPNIPLDIFISPDDSAETFDITYFNITHTVYETYSPTMDPTVEPTNIPVHDPTFDPTFNPTVEPTVEPTDNPTNLPTIFPTQIPTYDPTKNPTEIPIEKTTDSVDDHGSGNDGLKVEEMQMFGFDILLVIVAVIMTIAIVISLLDYIHSKTNCFLCCCTHTSDVSHYNIIITIGLRISNLILDIGILYRMCMYYFNSKAGITSNGVSVLILIFCSLILLVVTYFINIFSMHKIVKLESKTDGPILWFSKYMLFFVFLVMITSDSYLAVMLISSNVFGMHLFNSGHSTVEFNKIRALKFVTIILEHIPQIVIQIAYGAVVLNDMNATIIISIIISFLLSIPLLISWSLRNINNKLFTWEEYDIEILFELNDNIIGEEEIDDNNKNDPVSQIIKHSANKNILRKTLSSILGMNINKLEIGYVSINKNKSNSAYIHILHQIPSTTNGKETQSDLNGLYNNKYDMLSKGLRQIYNISLKYNIVCQLAINSHGYNNTQSLQKQSTEMVHIKVSTNANKNMNKGNNNKSSHTHDALPSSSRVSPFDLITSGSDADFDEDYVNQILDEKRKQMSMKPQSIVNNNNNEINIPSDPPKLMVINDNNNDKQSILHQSRSVIAVTPMDDNMNNVEVKNSESDSSSNSSSDTMGNIININNNDNEDIGPDLPSDDGEEEEEEEDIDMDMDMDMKSDNNNNMNVIQFRQHFKRLSSVEDMPNLPLPCSVISQASDIFGIGGNDLIIDDDDDNNPFIMPKMDDIPQPMVDKNIDDGITKGNQNSDDEFSYSKDDDDDNNGIDDNKIENDQSEN